MSGVLTGVSTAASKPGLGLGRSCFSGHWHGGQESGGARPSEPAALTCLVETLVAASWTGCDTPLPGGMVATASVSPWAAGRERPPRAALLRPRPLGCRAVWCCGGLSSPLLEAPVRECRPSGCPAAGRTSFLRLRLLCPGWTLTPELARPTWAWGLGSLAVAGRASWAWSAQGSLETPAASPGPRDPPQHDPHSHSCFSEAAVTCLSQADSTMYTF